MAPETPLGRNRDFQLLWSGQAVSLLGATVTQIAYPLLILALTGSATYAGLLGAAELLMFVVATLPAGLMADRLNRRTIMLVCDVARAVLVGGLAVLVMSGNVRLWMIIVAAMLGSVFDALFLPAAQGALKQVVPASQLSTAYAYREGRGAVAQLMGPPLGGWLFAMGRAIPFVFDAVTYALGAVALLFLRKPLQATRSGTAEPLWRGATKGFGFLWSRPLMRAVLGWAVLINVAIAGVPLLLIASATRYGMQEEATGVMIAFLGAGSLLGALLSPRLLRWFKPVVIVYAVAWGMAVGLGALAFIPWPLVLGGVTGAVMFLIPPLNALFNGYIAAMTPDELQGRVSSTLTVSVIGFKPIGPLAAGVVFDRFGPGWAFAVSAVVAALAALFTLDKSIRRMKAIEDLEIR